MCRHKSFYTKLILYFLIQRYYPRSEFYFCTRCFKRHYIRWYFNVKKALKRVYPSNINRILCVMVLTVCWFIFLLFFFFAYPKRDIFCETKGFYDIGAKTNYHFVCNSKKKIQLKNENSLDFLRENSRITSGLSIISLLFCFDSLAS